MSDFHTQLPVSNSESNFSAADGEFDQNLAELGADLDPDHSNQGRHTDDGDLSVLDGGVPTIMIQGADRRVMSWRSDDPALDINPSDYRRAGYGEASIVAASSIGGGGTSIIWSEDGVVDPNDSSLSMTDLLNSEIVDLAFHPVKAAQMPLQLERGSTQVLWHSSPRRAMEYAHKDDSVIFEDPKSAFLVQNGKGVSVWERVGRELSEDHMSNIWKGLVKSMRVTNPSDLTLGGEIDSLEFATKGYFFACKAKASLRVVFTHDSRPSSVQEGRTSRSAREAREKLKLTIAYRGEMVDSTKGVGQIVRSTGSARKSWQLPCSQFQSAVTHLATRSSSRGPFGWQEGRTGSAASQSGAAY